MATADDPARSAGLSRAVASRIALVYALLGALWILGSDWLVGQFVRERDWIVPAGALKGWLFIAVTAGLLYLLLRRLPGAAQPGGPAGARSGAPGEPTAEAPAVATHWGTQLALSALIVVLTAVALGFDFRVRTRQQARQVEAVAELRARQVGTWISDRLALAGYISHGATTLAHYRRWHDQGDQPSRALLRARLGELQSVFGQRATLVADRYGAIVLSDPGDAGAVSPPLHAAILHALHDGSVEHVGSPAGGEAPVRLWLDIVMPLVGAGLPAEAAVVMRLDAAESLLPMLQAWPVPSRSATTVLFERRDRQLVGVASGHSVALADSPALGARAVRGELPFGQAVDAVDFRGEAVLGAVQPVPGTPWYLVARMDRGEAHAEALQDSIWIGATGLLALLGVLVGSHLARQRRALLAAHVVQVVQAERLRALALVHSVAEASGDVIFAKDLEGRYLLFNGEAARVAGRTAQEVLGRSDEAIFPSAQAHQLRLNDARAMSEERGWTFEETLDTADGRITFLATKGPLRDDAGRVVGMFGISRDITGRKRAELALREAADLMQAVRDSVRSQMAVLDCDGVIVAVNSAWTEFAQANAVTAGEVPQRTGIGTNYLKVCRRSGGEDREAAQQAAEGIGAVLEGRLEQFTLEYPCPAPGRSRWFQVSVTPLRTRGGGAVVVHTDITQRRDAEDALRASEAQYRSMVSVLDEGIVVFDTQGRLQACNARAERFFGAELAQMRDPEVLRRWRPLRPDGSDLPYRELPFARTLRSGQACRDSLVGVSTPTGERRWLMVNAEPVRDRDDGPLTSVVTSFSDVTERHATEEQLRKLSLAMEVCPMGVVISDTQGRIDYVNPAYTRISGFTPEEAIGQLRIALQPDPQPPGRRDELRATLARGESWRGEMGTTRKNGERYLEFVHAAPIRLHDGAITHYLLIGEDITEHKRLGAELDRHRNHLEELVEERTLQLQQLNEALGESERFIRAVADSQPSRVSYWDRDLRCRFSSRAHREWFGRSEREIIGMSMEELLGAEWTQENRLFLPDVLAGHLHQVQRTGSDAQGHVVHSLIQYVPDRVGDEVVGFLIVASDITEIKQAELQLQQANTELVLSRDRAEAANRAKSVFLANMSHEIRTPMNAIIGLTHLLQRDAGDTLSAERLGQVAGAADHLTQLLGDILDLSKIEAGKLELEDTDFSLGAVLAACHSLVSARAQAKGLALHFEVGAVPDSLRGDPTRLQQALLNLLSNAVKFTVRGRVELQVEMLDRTARGPRLRFRVTDTGIGITQAKIGSLFTAFVQADASTTRRFGGTGLGLAITQRLVALMDGEVGVGSRPGEGSSFWFTACLQDAVQPQAPSPRLEAAAAEATLRRQHAQARVLLVEDNPVNQEVARALLHLVDLQVEVAQDGRQALDMLRQSRYDLILMDVQMPVMDGLEATRRLRLLPGMAAVPVLAMTANAFGEDRAACLAAGMDDHVAKPVDPAQMYGALLRWLPPRAGRREAAAPGGSGSGLAHPAAGSGAPADAAPDAALDELERLLAAADFQALALWRRLAPGLRTRFGAAVGELETELRGFDYPRAQAALRTLREPVAKP